MTLAELRRWAASAPAGTMVPAARLAEALEDVEPMPAPLASEDAPAPSWRVLLWTSPAEVRIGRDELLEAVGRSASWLYRHTGEKAVDRIPHRKLDGELVFVVGEVRHWLRDREEIVAAGPLDAPRLHALRGAG